MRRKLIVLTLLACFPMLPSWGQNAVPPPTAATGTTVEDKPVNRPVRDKWALVVGVSKFANGKVPGLKYAAKDARDFRNFLVNEANFAPDHVRLLLDEDATERRVISELGNKFLARVAKEDDLVVLYFSTHGSASQADLKGKNFLVAYDSDPEDLYASGINMDGILEAARDRIDSQRLLLVLDACHSGVIKSSEKGLGRPGNFDAEKFAQGSGKLVICSSNPEESSWESKRYENGIFTRKLLEGLRMNGKRTTLGDAFPFVQKAVAAEAQEDYAARQSPVLKSKWNGNELVLAIPSAAPQAVPVSVKQELQPDSTVPSVKPAQPAAIARKVSADYERGRKQFQVGDYNSAINSLTASLKNPNTARHDACYYLGMACSKLGRTAEARRWWQESVKADPISPAGINAQTQLSGMGTATAATYRQGSVSQSQLRASPTYPSSVNYAGRTNNYGNSGQSSGGSSQSTTAGLDPALINDVKRKLPTPVRCTHESPSASEVYTWPITQLAGFVNEAAVRKERAEQGALRARQAYDTAKSMLHSLKPQQPNYGESQAAFMQRRAAAEQVAKTLLCEYEQTMNTMQQYANTESQLYSTCLNARSGGGYGGYGGGYGGGGYGGSQPCK